MTDTSTRHDAGGHEDGGHEGGGAGDDPIITAQHLTKRFGADTPLDGLDLRVEPGEMVVITGRSGSGKSTLMHLLAALDEPDEGEIEVADVDVSHHRHLTNYRRTEIGLVFQLHNLIAHLTATQNVEVAMYGTHRSRDERRRRAAELLDQVGLDARADAYPPTMSGGERQRVAIARAMANEPAVILADEPTGSLDDDSAEQLVAALERLRRERGTTVLAVSHDPRFVERADRVLVLEKGVLHPR